LAHEFHDGLLSTKTMHAQLSHEYVTLVDRMPLPC
jgi:hypothetical protein